MNKLNVTDGEWVVDDDFSGYISNGNTDLAIAIAVNIKDALLMAQSKNMYEMIERDTKTIEDLIKTLPEYSNDWIFYKNELGIKMDLLAECRGEL